jgi:hypothetical protein
MMVILSIAKLERYFKGRCGMVKFVKSVNTLTKIDADIPVLA